MNSVKTAILLALLTGLLLVVGYFLGGQLGMLLALIFSAVMNFVSYFFSDKLALAAFRAQPATEAEAPKLHAIVQRLAVDRHVAPTSCGPSGQRFRFGR